MTGSPNTRSDEENGIDLAEYVSRVEAYSRQDLANAKAELHPAWSPTQPGGNIAATIEAIGDLTTAITHTVIRLEHLHRDHKVDVSDAPENARLPPAWSPTRSGSNVIPFARPRPDDWSTRSAEISISADARPPRVADRYQRARMALLMTLSLAIHLALYALPWDTAKPLPGEEGEPINIEIVVGGEPTPAADAMPETAPPADDPVDEVMPEQQVAEPPPPDQPVVEEPPPAEPPPPMAEREPTPDEQLQEPPVADAAPADAEPTETAAVEQQMVPEDEPAEPPPPSAETAADQPAEVDEPEPAVPMVETPIAEIPTVRPQETPAPPNARITPPRQRSQTTVTFVREKAKPKPKPQKKAEAPQPKRVVAKPKPAPKRIAQTRQPPSTTPNTNTQRPSAKRAPAQRPSPPSTPPPAANMSNYRALVAAHLQRFKQYPAAARAASQQGRGSVSFSIDGSGRVTSVSVGGRTGSAALDAELSAMVRRASPFPRPPNGQSMRFSVPVSFRLQ